MDQSVFGAFYGSLKSMLQVSSASLKDKHSHQDCASQNILVSFVTLKSQLRCTPGRSGWSEKQILQSMFPPFSVSEVRQKPSCYSISVLNLSQGKLIFPWRINTKEGSQNYLLGEVIILSNVCSLF